MTSTGEQVKEARTLLSWSRPQLAARVGLSIETIALFENGDRQLSFFCRRFRHRVNPRIRRHYFRRKERRGARREGEEIQVTSDEQGALDAAIASVQRIAMRIIELPPSSREVALQEAEQSFIEATTKFGIVPERGREFVALQIGAVRALIKEIEAVAGGATDWTASMMTIAAQTPAAVKNKLLRLNASGSFMPS